MSDRSNFIDFMANVDKIEMMHIYYTQEFFVSYDGYNLIITPTNYHKKIVRIDINRSMLTYTFKKE